MKHTRKWLLLVLIVLMMTPLITGCNSKAELTNLQQQNDELQDKISQLQKKNESLEQIQEQYTLDMERNNEEISSLTNQIDQLEARQELALFNDEHKFQLAKGEVELYRNYIKKLKNGSQPEQGTNILNMYNPAYIEKGDKIADFRVESVKKESSVSNSNSYFIDFSGEFTVKGRIGLNQVSSTKYYFCVAEADISKLPHTFEQRQSKRLCFLINNEEAFEQAFSEKLETVDFDSEATAEITFTDYNFLFVPETDVMSRADFKALN
jgi:outer membrane murein-binding lipoprotein Lpp